MAKVKFKHSDNLNFYIAILANTYRDFIDCVEANDLDVNDCKYINKVSDCIGRRFSDYFTHGVVSQDLVNSVVPRLVDTKNVFFNAPKTKNLAFPKDNFLRTQLDYEGHNEH